MQAHWQRHRIGWGRGSRQQECADSCRVRPRWGAKGLARGFQLGVLMRTCACASVHAWGWVWVCRIEGTAGMEDANDEAEKKRQADAAKAGAEKKRKADAAAAEAEKKRKADAGR